MTTASPPPPNSFDPDNFRMTIGEHLEDLRRRMIFGLLGFAVAIAGCASIFISSARAGSVSAAVETSSIAPAMESVRMVVFLQVNS